MSDPNNPDVDYTLMTGVQMITACGDSGARWARAFVQHMAKQGQPNINEHIVFGWFANIIETSHSVRNERAIAELVATIARTDYSAVGEPANDFLYGESTAPITGSATPVHDAGEAGSVVGADTPAAVHVQVTELSRDEWTRSRKYETGRSGGQVRRAGPLRRLLTRLGIVGP